MASCIAACTMARSRIDVGPGRTSTAVCVVIAFQSATTSAWAGAAQIKHTKTITPASLLRRIIGLLSSLDPAERRRENLFLLGSGVSFLNCELNECYIRQRRV